MGHDYTIYNIIIMLYLLMKLMFHIILNSYYSGFFLKFLYSKDNTDLYLL